eukprot:COSAG04_NODE_568_length_12543_cov_31.893282_1_plen_49_part_10
MSPSSVVISSASPAETPSGHVTESHAPPSSPGGGSSPAGRASSAAPSAP